MTLEPVPLRIAMVCPPWYALPPRGYGGIEAMCAALANGLVDRGHEVITIGAGPRGTRARHVTTYADPPTERIGDRWPDVVHAAQATQLVDELEPDVVHDHCLAGPLTARARSAPTLVTTHYTTTGEARRYYEAIARDVRLVAISAAQTRALPHLPWLGVVHNGIDLVSVPYQPVKDDYLLWLGRTSPEKGPVQAIDIARRTGRRLLMAGRSTSDHDYEGEGEYFNQVVKPLLGGDVEWLGEVGGADKWRLIGRAAGLLFPIQWDEPFGMVMIEAMATGTPVVAMNRGAVPEVVVDGVTGFVCADLDAMVAGVERLHTIDPATCRRHVRERFDVSVMAAEYELLYRAAVAEHRPAPASPGSGPKGHRRSGPRIPRPTTPTVETIRPSART